MADSVEEAFMEDVIAHPDDDAPRLIFADWLDDHGQAERAEFIRVQCQRERLSEDDERQRELRRRERELFAEHEEEWLGEAACSLASVWGLVPLHCTSRGMLDSLSLTPDDPALHGAELYRFGPLTQLNLHACGADFARLAESPFAGRLRAVNICPAHRQGLGIAAPTWDDLAPLLLSERLTGLRELSLAGMSLELRAVLRLLEAPCLENLQSLDLTGTGLTATAVEHVAGCAALTRLQTLWLEGNPIGPLGAQFLAGSRHLAGLRRLHMNGTRMTPPGIRALVGSGRLARLEELSAARNPLGNEGGLAVVEASLKGLTSLNLASTDLGRQGLTGMAESPLLRRLVNLDLSNNGLGDEAMPILAHCPAAVLQSLGLSGNEIGDAGAKVLAAWPGLSGLRHLGLSDNGLTAFGLKAVLSSPHLGPLRSLSLSGNRLRDLGAQVLARWPGLGRLADLTIDHNSIEDEGMQAILKSPHMKALRSLAAFQNDLGEATQRMLEGMEESGRIETVL